MMWCHREHVVMLPHTTEQEGGWVVGEQGQVGEAGALLGEGGAASAGTRRSGGRRGRARLWDGIKEVSFATWVYDWVWQMVTAWEQTLLCPRSFFCFCFSMWWREKLENYTSLLLREVITYTGLSPLKAAGGIVALAEDASRKHLT